MRNGWLQTKELDSLSLEIVQSSLAQSGKNCAHDSLRVRMTGEEPEVVFCWCSSSTLVLCACGDAFLSTLLVQSDYLSYYTCLYSSDQSDLL